MEELNDLVIEYIYKTELQMNKQKAFIALKVLIHLVHIALTTLISGPSSLSTT